MMEIITRKEAEARGLKRYFTGKACRNGHLCERLVSSYSCLECAQARFKEYYWKNRDRLNEVSRAWKIANPEKVKVHQATDYAAHRKERNTKARIYRAAHREELNIYFAAYNASHREARREAYRRWREKNLSHPAIRTLYFTLARLRRTIKETTNHDQQD